MNPSFELYWMCHPFVVRMKNANDLFARLEEQEHDLGGAIHDFEVEAPFRQEGSGQYYDAGDVHVDMIYEAWQTAAIHRFCQISLLYSIFEVHCCSLPVFDKKKLGKRDPRPNTVIFTLDECVDRGMKSTIWPKFQASIRTFIELRNSLIHSLTVTERMRSKLRPHIGNVQEFAGDSPDAKLKLLGNLDEPISVPIEFVRVMSERLEMLGKDVLLAGANRKQAI